MTHMEAFEPWLPFPEAAQLVSIEGVVDCGDEPFYVLVRQRHAPIVYRLQWDHRPHAYRNIDESYRLQLWQRFTPGTNPFWIVRQSTCRLRDVGHRATLLTWPKPSRILRRVSKRSPLTRRSSTSNRSGTTLSTNPICRCQTGSANFSKNVLMPTAPTPVPADLGPRFVLNSSASSPRRADRAQHHRSTTCAA